MEGLVLERRAPVLTGGRGWITPFRALTGVCNYWRSRIRLSMNNAVMPSYDGAAGRHRKM